MGRRHVIVPTHYISIFKGYAHCGGDCFGRLKHVVGVSTYLGKLRHGDPLGFIRTLSGPPTFPTCLSYVIFGVGIGTAASRMLLR
jgi:hypothetical protein